MTARQLPAILTALVVSVALVSCAGDPPRSDPTGVDGLRVPTPSPDPGDFVATVDNPWFPLVPGTVLVYRSAGEQGSRTNTVTVTGKTRTVAGVTTVVVHDVGKDAGGTVVEDTYDWYAQDTAGNVWYFGEDTTSYDGGRADTAGSWQAGLDGAQAGLVMAARPRVGDGYRQEYRVGVAEDRAEVVSLTERRDVPAGPFADLVETEDTTALEPGLVELTYYAKGIGVVLEETVAGGSGRVELISVTRP